MQPFATAYQEILSAANNIRPLTYAATRNFIDGDVTRLSPYFSRGVISPKQVVQVVLRRGYATGKLRKFLQEMAWREYFQRVWQAKGALIQQDLIRSQDVVAHHQMVAAVERAETGIEAIDAQILQLYETGYMHNHVRMYIASICCNVAKAHWLRPSQWMYYHLFDGDIASNNCNWQWIAGVFSSKKYYCNQENINRYTYSGQRNSFLDGSYAQIVSMDIPEPLRETMEPALRTVLPATPLPAIDTTKPTLLYNAYNLDPAWHADEAVNRVLLLEPAHYEQYPVSNKVIEFVLALSNNIQGIQVYCGQPEDIAALYAKAGANAGQALISKEHPAFSYYPGSKEDREWLFPSVTGYYPSFSKYWKKCEPLLDSLL